MPAPLRLMMLPVVALALLAGAQQRTEIESKWCPVREGPGQTPVTCQRPEHCPESRVLWTGGDLEGSPRRVSTCGDGAVCCLPPPSHAHMKRFVDRVVVADLADNDLRNATEPPAANPLALSAGWPGRGAHARASWQQGAAGTAYARPEDWGLGGALGWGEAALRLFPSAPGQRFERPQLGQLLAQQRLLERQHFADQFAPPQQFGEQQRWPPPGRQWAHAQRPRPAQDREYVQSQAQQAVQQGWPNPQWGRYSGQQEHRVQTQPSGQQLTQHEATPQAPQDYLQQQPQPHQDFPQQVHPYAQQGRPQPPQDSPQRPHAYYSEHGGHHQGQPQNGFSPQHSSSYPQQDSQQPPQRGGFYPQQSHGQHVSYAEHSSHQQAPSSPQQAHSYNQQAPFHPQQASSYPQPAPSYPQQAPSYPQQAPSYPQQAPSYPQPAPSYPQQALSYPQQAPSYPQQAPSYPQQAPSYPQQAPSYPQQPSSFHHQAPSYSQQSPSIPQQAPSYPQQASSYPRQENSYAQQAPSHPQRHHNSYPQGSSSPHQGHDHQRPQYEPQQVHSYPSQDRSAAPFQVVEHQGGLSSPAQGIEAGAAAPPPPPHAAPHEEDGPQQGRRPAEPQHHDEGAARSPNVAPNHLQPVGPGVRSRQMCERYSRATRRQLHATSLLLSGDHLVHHVGDCNNPISLVVGGQNASQNEFPHMAAVGFRSGGPGGELGWWCGGSLVSDQFVLTAAHCTHTAWGSPVVVRVGTTFLADAPPGAPAAVDVAVAEVVAHPLYAPPARYHDVALLRLERALPLSERVRPACLPPPLPQPADQQQDGDLPAEALVVATGWGRLSYAGDASDVLQKVPLRVWPRESCARAFQPDQQGLGQRRLQDGLGPGMLCAGAPHSNKDTCQGDSGGPLQRVRPEDPCAFEVVGITSFGKQCGLGLPAVYTKVSFYVAWIESVIWPQ